MAKTRKWEPIPWGTFRKANFTWNMRVTVYIDGELAAEGIRVRDTHQWDGLMVERMAGRERAERVWLKAVA